MKDAPNLDKSAIELFASYDTVNVHWVLGGKICGISVQPSLVLLRVNVIDNESYVALSHCSPRLTNNLFSAILLGNTFEGSFNMEI